ncbi:eukaryotic translation initiation factor 3 subunit h [Brevipalpus obovatus]|uniref:eukaryotic translation initiation factor 3 subunit h n=1 Tax=Brevipalpus obovatus TaxID=246614 RepID=UPI003D9DC2B6
MMIHKQFQQQQRKTDGPISFVQIDGLVLLKIIKHCQEEGGINADIQGVLVGLVRDQCLEVTNCFPFPQFLDDEDNEQMNSYQHIMMKHLRSVNVDHLQIGWYSSNPYGNNLAKMDIVDSMFVYQNAIEESIVLLYDPVRTQLGFLSVKAFRLTNTAFKLCKDAQFTTENLKESQMSFEKFFEEVPIKIHNSHLVKGLFCEIEERMLGDEGKQFLEMGRISMLEKTLTPLMRCVGEVYQYNSQQRQITIRQQQIAKDNAARVARGDPPLTEEEVAKIVRPLGPSQRLDALLNYCQTLNYCQLTSTVASQNIAKLFMARGLKEATKTDRN